VWATRHAALFELAQDSVMGTVQRGLVRPAFAQDLLQRRLAERPGYFGEMVWILMMLEQWLRAHAPDYEV
jgi:asparagine synthase (glutamine-hydrolysing)